MVEIIKAKLGDFKDIFKLLKKLYLKDRLMEKKTKEIYINHLKQKESLQLIIRKQKVIVGYATVQMCKDIQSQGKIGYLSELIIDESYRGEGIGARFLKEIMKQSKKSGCKEIQFPSTFKRRKAHRFYESLGFKKISYFFWKTL